MNCDPPLKVSPNKLHTWTLSMKNSYRTLIEREWGVQKDKIDGTVDL